MTEKNIIDFDEDEETEDEGFTCDECGTPLIEDITDAQPPPHPQSTGYGCPECIELYCPFCQKSISEWCDHLIFIGGSYTEVGEYDPPFNEKKELRETLEKFMPRLKQVLEKHDWSEEQKKQAFGTMSSAYETFASEIYKTFASEIERTHDPLSSIYSALPDTSGIACKRFYVEGISGHSTYDYGIWCEKRDDYLAYWTEQATSFITSLEKLVLMEPKISR